jgi:hypothetical protein
MAYAGTARHNAKQIETPIAVAFLINLPRVPIGIWRYINVFELEEKIPG